MIAIHHDPLTVVDVVVIVSDPVDPGTETMQVPVCALAPDARVTVNASAGPAPLAGAIVTKLVLPLLSLAVQLIASAIALEPAWVAVTDCAVVAEFRSNETDAGLNATGALVGVAVGVGAGGAGDEPPPPQALSETASAPRTIAPRRERVFPATFIRA
ncbi:MAG: hypothetical protein ACREM8_03395 [Vulcanimicrobiaceae bacterium]